MNVKQTVKQSKKTKVLIFDETKNPSMKNLEEPKKCPHFENPSGKCALMGEDCERADADDFANFETCYIFQCKTLFERQKIAVVYPKTVNK